MLRKFNYTGRKKIETTRVKIVIHENSGEKYFDLVSLNLEGMELPDSASIYIEPHMNASFKRFYFGTVGNRENPEDRSLEGLPFSGIIYFRVKVVDESGIHGRLLASAPKIKTKPLVPGVVSGKSLLHVDFDDIGPKIWNLSFPDDTGSDYIRPTLQVNNKDINNVEDAVGSDTFICLVYPAIVREIAKKVAFFTDDYDEGDDHWKSLWYKYFRSKLNIPEKPENNEENRENLDIWVDDVVNSFCRLNRVKQKFIRMGEIE